MKQAAGPRVLHETGCRASMVSLALNVGPLCFLWGAEIYIHDIRLGGWTWMQVSLPMPTGQRAILQIPTAIPLTVWSSPVVGGECTKGSVAPLVCLTSARHHVRTITFFCSASNGLGWRFQKSTHMLGFWMLNFIVHFLIAYMHEYCHIRCAF